MELFTKIAFPSIDQKIDYHTKAVFMGSCFSENIGGWLKEMKFDALNNPCGIAYNPISIANHILRSLTNNLISESELLLSRKTYVHPDFHGSLNHIDAKSASNQINNAIHDLRSGLQSSSFLFLTFGTSIAFSLKANGQIINNCHHLPASDFSKKFLSEKELLSAFDLLYPKLSKVVPNLKIILTVSPIRHLRHGAIDNSRSKSRLIRLCELLEEKYANTIYFPIYEFVMDELRDYRFYRQDDLIHMNDLGIDLIREKFTEFFISENALKLMDRVRKWKKMKAHKMLNSNSFESAAFLQKVEQEEIELKKILPERF